MGGPLRTFSLIALILIGVALVIVMSQRGAALFVTLAIGAIAVGALAGLAKAPDGGPSKGPKVLAALSGAGVIVGTLLCFSGAGGGYGALFAGLLVYFASGALLLAAGVAWLVSSMRKP